jgi:hypothetical protein
MSTTYTIVHPNSSKHGHWDIHRCGCADLKRVPAYDRYEVEATSLKDIVEDVYGPAAGSFYEENGFEEDDPKAWEFFAGEFRALPCAGHLKSE